MFTSSWLFCHTQLWNWLQCLFIQKTISMTCHSRTFRFVTLFLYLQKYSDHPPKLVVTTTHNLLVYGLPTVPTTEATESPKKKKKTTKTSIDDLNEKISSLSLQKSVPLPSLTGEGSTFRAARYVLSLYWSHLIPWLLDTIHRINGFYSALLILSPLVHGKRNARHIFAYGTQKLGLLRRPRKLATG